MKNTTEINRWINLGTTATFNWGSFAQQSVLLRFRTNSMAKRENSNVAPIEFRSSLKPNTEFWWSWTGSTLLWTSSSLISLIFWFSFTTSSIFLSFSFSSCISISFWCRAYCSSSFFSKYPTFSWRISTSRFMSRKSCLASVICSSSFYEFATVFCFLVFGLFCNIYEPMFITMGEGDEPFLWLFLEGLNIGISCSDSSELSVFDLAKYFFCWFCLFFLLYFPSGF